MNGYRCVGDFIHLFAICFLFVRLLVSRSSAGVSAKTQLLYAVVFTSRYTDLIITYGSAYNTTFKILFLIFSYSICILILGIYKKTYDYWNDIFHYELLLFGAGVLGIAFHYDVSTTEVLWAFSIYLEAVALLPQFFMMKKLEPYKHKDILLYLTLMFLYRLFYIFNWIYSYHAEDHYNYDVISIIGGTVQVILHWEFICSYIINIADVIDEAASFLVMLSKFSSIKEAIVAYRSAKAGSLEHAIKEAGEEAVKVETDKETSKDVAIYTITV